MQLGFHFRGREGGMCFYFFFLFGWTGGVRAAAFCHVRFLRFYYACRGGGIPTPTPFLPHLASFKVPADLRLHTSATAVQVHPPGFALHIHETIQPESLLLLSSVNPLLSFLVGRPGTVCPTFALSRREKKGKCKKRSLGQKKWMEERFSLSFFPPFHLIFRRRLVLSLLLFLSPRPIHSTRVSTAE